MRAKLCPAPRGDEASGTSDSVRRGVKLLVGLVRGSCLLLSLSLCGNIYHFVETLNKGPLNAAFNPGDQYSYHPVTASY